MAFHGTSKLAPAWGAIRRVEQCDSTAHSTSYPVRKHSQSFQRIHLNVVGDSSKLSTPANDSRIGEPVEETLAVGIASSSASYKARNLAGNIFEKILE